MQNESLAISSILLTTRSRAEDPRVLLTEISQMAKHSHFALSVAFFGVLAFLFGVIAENKKPLAGTEIEGRGGVYICNYPKNDPTIILGSLSVVALLISAVLGFFAVFYPYNGKSVPVKAFLQSTVLTVFFVIATATTLLGEAMMLWATITEGIHRTNNVHRVATGCPTAKTGLFGGAAFLALDGALFWLVCQMLTSNARADYLDEDEDPKGSYGQVTTGVAPAPTI